MMLIRPTHVMVAFEKVPGEFHQYPVTMEEFASLFTYGTAHAKDVNGHWSQRNELRAVPSNSEGER